MSLSKSISGEKKMGYPLFSGFRCYARRCCTICMMCLIVFFLSTSAFSMGRAKKPSEKIEVLRKEAIVDDKKTTDTEEIQKDSESKERRAEARKTKKEEDAAALPSTEVVVTSPTVAVEEKDEGLIDFNLKGVKIDDVIKFIAEHTNKPVVKKKDVSAELTISSPKKISSAQALDLIYDSLLLEGIVVIESEDRVQIVKVEEVKQQDLITLSGPIPEEMMQQKSMVIRRVLPLNYARVTDIKPYLDPLLGKYADVTADERTNKLIIIDTIRNIERYENIILELDITGFDQKDVRIIQLRYGDATEISRMLEQFVTGESGGTRSSKSRNSSKQPRPSQSKQGEGASSPDLTVSIIPDVRTNSLIIAAPRDKMQSILDLVARLDVEKPKELETQLVSIEYADAQEVANNVMRLFRKTTGKSMKDLIEIIATERGNNILVLASPENFRMILDIINQLDTEEAQKKETKTYELKHLDAFDTATELDELYSSLQSQRRSVWDYYYGRQQRKEVNFVPVTRTNSIMVIAPPTEFKLIESLIKEIDQPLAMEEVLPKIYYIENAKATDVEDVLNEIFGTGKQDQRRAWWEWRDQSEDEGLVGRLSGKIRFSSDENTNSIIAITNNRANYEVVDRIIDKLDRSIAELANTMIYRLNHADAKELSYNLNILFGRPQKPSGKQDEEGDEFWSFWWGDQKKEDEGKLISTLIGQVRFVPDPRTNAILVTTASHNFNIIRELIRELDKPEPQVLIKVRIVEIVEDKSKRIGLRWTPDPGIFRQEDLDNAISVLNGLNIIDTFGSDADSDVEVSGDIPGGISFDKTLGAGKGIISGTVNLSLLFQLLVKNLEANIVINPTLYVSNNKPGRIFVGENIPRLTESQTTAEGSLNQSFKNEDIGIEMKITPHINQDGTVFMTVELITQQTTGQVRFGSDLLQKREYTTEVAVQGGETMVLGGIKLTTKQKVVRKFPILGSIPLIGLLFRNYDTVNNETNLYAFISPEVIATEEEAHQATETIMEEVDETYPEKDEDDVLSLRE